ncbi:MAG TPA: response regulator, partial [bacterium]|nr:response regulator [bacterium]
MNDNEKANILLVDDKPENLLALETILDDENVELFKANSGNQALALILEHDFALTLLDVQMPNMDGFETAELMRGNKKTRHIPIIFVTAINKEQKYIFKGYEAGAVDYLFKPLEPEILKSKVKVFLDLYNQKKLIKKQALELEHKVTELNAAFLELQKKEKILHQQAEELAAINQDLKEFAYIVSHDLKAPLRAISSLVNWLTSDFQDKLDDKGREM